MEYSLIKVNELLIHIIIWIYLEIIMTEKSQSTEYILYDSVCHESLENASQSIVTENVSVVA